MPGAPAGNAGLWMFVVDTRVKTARPVAIFSLCVSNRAVLLDFRIVECISPELSAGTARKNRPVQPGAPAGFSGLRIVLKSGDPSPSPLGRVAEQSEVGRGEKPSYSPKCPNTGYIPAHLSHPLRGHPPQRGGQRRSRYSGCIRYTENGRSRRSGHSCWIQYAERIPATGRAVSTRLI